MKKLKIGVLGATGAVGQEMLKILEEYDIPVEELRPLASARSAGSLIRFQGRDVAIQAATEESFEGLDFVQIHVLPEGPGKVGPSVETLRRISNACRKHGVNLETYLLKNGDKDFAYETLLDAGVMSIATDFPSKAREVIAKYCESKK